MKLMRVRACLFVLSTFSGDSAASFLLIYLVTMKIISIKMTRRFILTLLKRNMYIVVVSVIQCTSFTHIRGVTPSMFLKTNR